MRHFDNLAPWAAVVAMVGMTAASVAMLGVRIWGLP